VCELSGVCWSPHSTAHTPLYRKMCPLICAPPPPPSAQVLQNFINNAIKFTPAGGNIAVRCYADPTYLAARERWVKRSRTHDNSIWTQQPAEVPPQPPRRCAVLCSIDFTHAPAFVYGGDLVLLRDDITSSM
jgi:hypothetical protein